MRPQDIIAVRARDGWRPSIAMLREIRRKGLTPALSSKSLMADAERKPVSSFLGWWRSAFGYEAAMPSVSVAMITPEGKGDSALVDLWESLT